jgi:hypothetical protein
MRVGVVTDLQGRGGIGRGNGFAKWGVEKGWLVKWLGGWVLDAVRDSAGGCGFRGVEFGLLVLSGYGLGWLRQG